MAWPKKGSLSADMKALLFKGLRLLEVGVVVAVLGGVYFSHLESVRFHGDESHWIATSCFWEAWVTPGFIEPPWLSQSVVPDEFPMSDRLAATLASETSPTHVWGTHYWTLTQPPVSRYMIALGRIAGGYGVADLNAPWDFEVSDAQNTRMGAMPSPGLLWSSRATMAFLSVISGTILFMLVRRCAGPVGGYAFVVLFVGSEFLRLHLRRAMSEAPLLFFTVLALLCAARALSMAQRHLWRSMAWLLLMGVCAGLAGAAKLNGLMLGFAGMALCFAVAYQHRGRDAKWPWVAVGAAILVLAIALAVFGAVNPFLYRQPLLRTAAMVQFRRWEMTGQTQNSQWHIPDLFAWLGIVPRRILSEYPAVHFGLINGLLAALGLYALAHAARRRLAGKEETAGATGAAILTVAAVTALPMLTTPLDWDRYYMYPVLFVSVGMAVGLGWIVQNFPCIVEHYRND